MMLTKLHAALIGLAAFLTGVLTTSLVFTTPAKPIQYYTYFCREGISHSNIKDYIITGNTLTITQTLLGTPLKDAKVVVVLQPGCTIVPQSRLLTTREDLFVYMNALENHIYKGN